MISVIDMPGPEESIWWRGKRGFEVGFFPCECVEVIGDKVGAKEKNSELIPLLWTGSTWVEPATQQRNTATLNQVGRSHHL